MSVRNKVNRKHTSGSPEVPGTGSLESPENFHRKTDHQGTKERGVGMERILDRSENMDRELDQDPKRQLDDADEPLDSDLDREDELGHDPDDDPNHPSVRGV
ncbi:MAG TPA: hypothetical protein VFD72_05810 [Sphingobacteriaceae bacterium]|nr:hypothetical protein [Sphingobacteriaceae bacterium]